MKEKVEYIQTNRIPKVTKTDVKKYPIIACFFPAVYSTFSESVVEDGTIYFWHWQPTVVGTTVLSEKKVSFSFNKNLPAPKEIISSFTKNQYGKTQVEYKTTIACLDKMQDSINKLIKKEEEFFYEYSFAFAILLCNPKTEEILIRHYMYRSQMPKHTTKLLLTRKEYEKHTTYLSRNIFNTILWRRLTRNGEFKGHVRCSRR